MRTFAIRAMVGATLLLLPGPASANGRFPASNQIVFSPADPTVVMARTTFALLPSHDDGATWRYLCENALGLPSTSYEDPELAFTAGGALVAALSAPTRGLDVSGDLGCSWSCVGGGLRGQEIVDTVVRPDTPHHVLALTGTLVDGGAYTQVFESGDDGATWAPLGVPLDPSVIVTTLDVSATDPMRIYVSGTRGFGASRTASLFASSDGAATWVEHPIAEFLGAQQGGETSIFIGAVDPTDEDRVYLRSSGALDGGESRLYVTTDGGMTFTIAKDFQVEGAGLALVGELLGFALAPDGSRIFVGTKESGLWSAARADMAFSQVNATVGVQCLATRQTAAGMELWACGNEYKGPPGNPGNFIVGRSTDDGATFETKLATLTSLDGLAQCGSNPQTFACGLDASTAACTCTDYVAFCTGTEVPSACRGCGLGPAGGTAGDDAGDGGGGTQSEAGGEGGPGEGGPGGLNDAATMRRTATPSSCGCTLIGRGGGAGALLALWLAVAAAARRRTR